MKVGGGPRAVALSSLPVRYSTATVVASLGSASSRSNTRSGSPLQSDRRTHPQGTTLYMRGRFNFDSIIMDLLRTRGLTNATGLAPRFATPVLCEQQGRH